MRGLLSRERIVGSYGIYVYFICLFFFFKDEIAIREIDIYYSIIITLQYGLIVFHFGGGGGV